jgi:hypothetical protein
LFISFLVKIISIPPPQAGEYRKNQTEDNALSSFCRKALRILDYCNLVKNGKNGIRLCCKSAFKK